LRRWPQLKMRVIRLEASRVSTVQTSHERKMGVLGVPPECRKQFDAAPTGLSEPLIALIRSSLHASCGCELWSKENKYSNKSENASGNFLIYENVCFKSASAAARRLVSLRQNEVPACNNTLF